MATNFEYLARWIFGQNQKYYAYSPDSVQSQEMQRSPAADYMRQVFKANNNGTTKNIAYGTGRAFWDTLANPLTADWSSTAAEVGGFGGASVTNNGNGTATFMIRNVTGTHSAFYHSVPDRKGTEGPGRTVVQVFKWTERIPKRNELLGSSNPAGSPKMSGRKP